MKRSFFSWKRLKVWLMVMLSVGFLLNSILVFVAIHGQVDGEENHLIHGALRGGYGLALSVTITQKDYWERLVHKRQHAKIQCNPNATTSGFNPPIPFLKDVASSSSFSI